MTHRQLAGTAGVLQVKLSTNHEAITIRGQTYIVDISRRHWLSLGGLVFRYVYIYILFVRAGYLRVAMTVSNGEDMKPKMFQLISLTSLK